MSVSPDTVLLPPVLAAPQPPSVPVASAAAVAHAAPAAGSDPNRADAAPAAGAGAADTQGPPAGSEPAPGRSTGRKSGVDKNSVASRNARPSSASAAKSPAHTAHAGGNFSQTLAQSLAAHVRADAGAGSDASAGHGKSSAKSSAAHAPAKGRKPDPVQSALALVSHGVPAAPALATANAAKGQGAAASVVAASKDAVHSVKALLAHAAAQEAKALTALSSASSAAPAQAQTPTLDAAAALGAVQLGLGSTLTMQNNAAANPVAALSAPVGTGAWTEELGSRLTWMTHQGIESASLQLSPEHLGPLQVSISVHHGQASVWFGATHPETRQALEQAMPQLRQMLSNQGLTLTDSGVSRDSPRERAPQQIAVQPIDAVGNAVSDGMSSPVSAHVGLVDAYA